MTSRPMILVVDDDPHIRDVVRYALEKESIAVLEAGDGQEGLRQALRHRPDVIVLDVMMPEMNGLDMCRELRRTAPIPVLFLSSRDGEIDRIIGLEMGGDDYVTKPFSPRELVARVKAMLRRQAMLGAAPSEPAETDTLKRGDIALSLKTFQVVWKETPVALTTTEFNLLHLFMQTPQKVFTRDELVQADIFRDIVSDRTIDSHIRRLRRKFAEAGCDSAVETAHGFGYKLGSCV